MKDDLELNSNPKILSNEQVPDVTTELTNHDSSFSAGRQLMVLPPTAEQRKLRLRTIAKEICGFEIFHR